MYFLETSLSRLARQCKEAIGTIARRFFDVLYESVSQLGSALLLRCCQGSQFTKGGHFQALF
jgi:hypothetical protein